ncbi:Zinc Finger Mym-Type Protein 4 [Manis pentadactyla]|nr:Zinc Finger Mym-Type Protein 4 [Manis pentadactyla]
MWLREGRALHTLEEGISLNSGVKWLTVKKDESYQTLWVAEGSLWRHQSWDFSNPLATSSDWQNDFASRLKIKDEKSSHKKKGDLRQKQRLSSKRRWFSHSFARANRAGIPESRGAWAKKYIPRSHTDSPAGLPRQICVCKKSTFPAEEAFPRLKVSFGPTTRGKLEWL